MGNGTEIVMVYSPSRSSPSDEKQTFYTDSNGRQMVKRVQDTRFSYDLEGGNKIEPVSSNYYPINSAIMTQVGSETWSVLTDRSQGATKINPDEIEIMVHRRLFKDDHFGVDEPLDEHAFEVPMVARGKHLVYKNEQDNSIWRRLKSQEFYMGPLVMMHSGIFGSSLEEWLEKGIKEFSVLNQELPENVHLMTVENWDNRENDPFDILLRFEHMFENSEEGGESIEIEIQEDIFKGLQLTDLVELSLGGDRSINEVQNKLKWSKSNFVSTISISIFIF